MSLILDALRKSDDEHSQRRAPEVARSGKPVATRSGNRWIGAIALLLIINAIALGGLLLRDTTPTTSPPVSQQADAVANNGLDNSQTFTNEKADVRSLLEETIRDAKAERASRTVNVERSDPPAQQAQPAPVASDLPTANALRAGGLLTVGPLKLELHVFNDSPASRFAFVNGQKITEGDQLESGPRVMEITRNGVILVFEGQRFLLARQ